MTGSPDHGRTLGDIALLFELSLAVGTSIDLEENCRRFLITLMARKSLDLSSLWLRADALTEDGRVAPATDAPPPESLPYHLLFAAPQAHVRGRSLEAGHALLQRAGHGCPFRLQPDAPEAAPLRGEFREGVFAVFPLPPRGLVALHSSTPNAFDDRELRQLDTVIAKLAVSVEGCIAHAQAVREIEERKRAEAERAAVRERLHQSEKMEAVGRLAGGIAHDFNNLLTGVLGCTELLRTEAASARDRELLDVATQAAQSATELTGQLLAFSRLPSLEERPVALDALVRQVAALLRRTVDPAIRIDVDLRLGDATAVLGDASRLQGTLLNLGLNGRDAIADRGTIAISTHRVTLDAAATAQHEAELTPGVYARVRVSDTGSGMPPETVARIFEPFFTTKATGRGTGLGLAAVYGTVTAHKGAISVRSEVGRGTCFELLLPTIEAAPAAARPTSPIRGHGRLLVVDDDATARKTFALMCDALGYTVQTADSGESALAILAGGDPAGAPMDLVLLDVRMPGLSGLETLEQIRVRLPDLPVVMTSGFVEESRLQALRNLGIQGFLQKPATLEDLSLRLAAARTPPA